MKWNEQQKLAIETCYLEDEPQHRCNILVNAAAGSGKTAVLVERIIRKIEKPGGSDIDRLLVVTFTRAAAAEMQQKINRALVSRMENESLTEEERAHLMHQVRLLSGADICNIDSYCMRVVRNNFHILGVDPNFSPVSGGELEIMKDEAMDLLFEELYEGDGEDGFVRLAEMFSQTGNDSGLAEIIKKLYNFTTSLPEPEVWMNEAIERIDGMSLEDSFSGVKNDVVEKVQNILCTAATNLVDMHAETFGEETGDYTLDELVVMAQQLAEKYSPEGDNELTQRWGSLWGNVVSDFEAVLPLYNAVWHEVGGVAGGIGIDSFPTELAKVKYKKIKEEKKKKSVDATQTLEKEDGEATEKSETTAAENEQTAETAKREKSDNAKLFAILRLRHDEINSKCGELAQMLATSPAEEMRIVKQFSHSDITELCRLTTLFAKKLDLLKQRRGVLEFCDIERLVYRLLRDNPDIKREYNEKYDEVLIDEYQDVNALQDAIFATISTGENLFMVGDMKQSIYRFRNSDPTIFKYKTDTYHDKYNRVINLNKNYRSRENVLESINSVFSVIMSENAGEINYDYTQRLNAGDLNYENINEGASTDNRSELILIRKDSESEMSSAEAEAKFIAGKIREMIDGGFKVRRTVTDRDGKQSFVYENARPRDFVILVNSLKGLVDIYTDALEKAGLLCYAETGGYFDRSEIMAVMSIIKMIENPLNDISFVASMRLPVCGFSDDELASVRLAGKGCMYDCAVRMSGVDTELGKKCKRFLDMLENWRFYAKIMSCDKLIWTIYEETDIYSYYGTLDNGEEAQANLRMLFERAKEFENTGFKGLFNFIRFVEKITNYSSDYSEAKLISEEHEVVRMMTMHKSKGLEFPVVFVAGGTKNFKFDEGKNICYHKDKGIGLAYVNYEMRYSVPTILTREIERQNKFETIAERMRLWYVAMTRAKEKLIITAPEKRGIQTLSFSESNDNSHIVNSGRSFFEWIAPIAKADNLWKYSEIIVYDEGDNGAESKKESIELEIGDKSGIFEWQYPYRQGTVSPAKVSVTEVKRRKLLADMQDVDSGQMFKKASVRKRPSFMEEQRPLTGAQRGTVVHYVMQTLPVFADKKIIIDHIASLVESGQLTQKEADCVDVEKVLAFYSTDLAKRIQNSPRVYDEVPFEIMVPSSEVYGFEGEEVILQGIIDCCFEENGDMVLLDYKTDYYAEGTGHELAEKYKIQLDKYAEAIEKITGKRVKGKYLYLFNHNDVVECI